MKKLLMLSLSSMLLLSPIASIHADVVDDCSKELLLSYFPEPFVRETLKTNNVPQDKWESIVTELKNNDKQVVGIVEEKAAKLNPNPLKNPGDQEQRQKAVAIFRETLMEIFSAALNKNGITDTKQIQTMLDDVQHQKAKRFKECLEKHKNSVDANLAPAPSEAANTARSATDPTAMPENPVTPTPTAMPVTPALDPTPTPTPPPVVTPVPTTPEPTTTPITTPVLQTTP